METESVSLRIQADVLRSVACSAVSPHEICGLLLGELGDDEVRVVGWQACRNRLRSASAFEIEPIDYRDVEKGADRDGLRIVGLIHSHPGGSACLSRSDIHAATRIWGESSDWVYLVYAPLAVDGNLWGAWMIRRGEAREIAVNVE